MTTSEVSSRLRLDGDSDLRLLWFAVAVPVYTFAAAFAQVLGEVVGEAWGGAFLHLLGHAIGTVLHVWLLAAAAWLVLRRRVAWAQPWATAGAVGALFGLVVYVPILSFATTPEELIIAFSLHLPLAAAAVAQWRALRDRVRRPGRWAVSWYFAILAGVAASWFAGGGVEGASAGSPFPVFDKAIAYWWLVIPRSLLGGVVFAIWSAVMPPLAGGLSARTTAAPSRT